MDRLELVGGILAEPLIFKYEPSEEDVVEIGIEDVGSDDDQSEDELESKEGIANCFQENHALIKQENEQIALENEEDVEMGQQASEENEQIALENEEDVEMGQQASEETYYGTESDSNSDCEIMATWEESGKSDKNGGSGYVVPKTEPKDVILSYPNNCAENRIEQTQLQEILREKSGGNTTGGLALSLLNNGSTPQNQTATTICQIRQAEQEDSNGKAGKETTVNTDVEKNNVNDHIQEKTLVPDRENSLLFLLLSNKQQDIGNLKQQVGNSDIIHKQENVNNKTNMPKSSVSNNSSSLLFSLLKNGKNNSSNSRIQQDRNSRVNQVKTRAVPVAKKPVENSVQILSRNTRSRSNRKKQEEQAFRQQLEALGNILSSEGAGKQKDPCKRSTLEEVVVLDSDEDTHENLNTQENRCLLQERGSIPVASLGKHGGGEATGNHKSLEQKKNPNRQVEGNENQIKTAGSSTINSFPKYVLGNKSINSTQLTLVPVLTSKGVVLTLCIPQVQNKKLNSPGKDHQKQNQWEEQLNFRKRKREEGTSKGELCVLVSSSEDDECESGRKNKKTRKRINNSNRVNLSNDREKNKDKPTVQLDSTQTGVSVAKVAKKTKSDNLEAKTSEKQINIRRDSVRDKDTVILQNSSINGNLEKVLDGSMKNGIGNSRCTNRKNYQDPSDSSSDEDDCKTGLSSEHRGKGSNKVQRQEIVDTSQRGEREEIPDIPEENNIDNSDDDNNDDAWQDGACSDNQEETGRTQEELLKNSKSKGNVKGDLLDDKIAAINRKSTSEEQIQDKDSSKNDNQKSIIGSTNDCDNNEVEADRTEEKDNRNSAREAKSRHENDTDTGNNRVDGSCTDGNNHEVLRQAERNRGYQTETDRVEEKDISKNKKREEGQLEDVSENVKSSSSTGNNAVASSTDDNVFCPESSDEGNNHDILKQAERNEGQQTETDRVEEKDSSKNNKSEERQLEDVSENAKSSSSTGNNEVDSSTDDDVFGPDESSDDDQEGTDRLQGKYCVTNVKRWEKRKREQLTQNGNILDKPETVAGQRIDRTLVSQRGFQVTSRNQLPPAKNLSISQNKLGPHYPNSKNWKEEWKKKRAKKVQEYFWCGQCEYKAPKKCILMNHITARHTKPENMMDRMKKCDRCPKMFKFAARLRRHKLYVHEKKEEFRCSTCDFKTFCKSSILSHIRRHRESETLQKCSRCDAMISSKRRMYHMQKFHGEMFQCHVCSYTTTFHEKLKLHLITHKEVLEDKDYKYRCDQCPYKTYRHYSLRVHKLNHLKPEEIQYFHCYHCEFKAKRKDNLKTHILKQHTEQYQCVYCDFTTSKRGELVRHTDKHAKEQ